MGSCRLTPILCASSKYSSNAWPKVQGVVAAETRRWRALCGQGRVCVFGGGRQVGTGGGWKKVAYLP